MPLQHPPASPDLCPVTSTIGHINIKKEDTIGRLCTKNNFGPSQEGLRPLDVHCTAPAG